MVGEMREQRWALIGLYKEIDAKMNLKGKWKLLGWGGIRMAEHVLRHRAIREHNWRGDL